MAQFRFAFLLELAMDAREDAARRMQASQALWLSAQGKLDQIDQYRVEYRAKLLNNGQGGMGISQWRDFQLFLAKLDDVALSQQQDINRLLAIYESQRDAWLECEKKVKAFEALKKRHLSVEMQKELRNEQRINDEFNTRPRPR
ncbi:MULTISPECIES: flagellar export protein FliJ [unclassified Iodobacter]|uniref:flagellar export protein FliJ n=1 Tax=unclassified Iodobacter TaxID=235634 RepID=UPI0025FA44B9|nr:MULTISPECIES: flagellar export protein FliJ [unclassified Iodobacter]MDW5416487.1 flagellar export protein FliJ [Iodobacter sp. CM08]